MNFDWGKITEALFVYSPGQPILYTRPAFWALFCLIMGGYSVLYRKKGIRNFYLLAISLFLYYKTNGSFLALLLFSAGFNYLSALLINKGKTARQKKIFLAASISVNLLVLGYFKYAYFFTESFNRLFQTDIEVVNWLVLWENNLFGTSFDVSAILLPVGISFYTFQSLSYVADVYKGRVQAVRNFIDFSFYLTFFPQLVAGPIVRASAFIPQLYQKYRLTREEFGHALFMILKGLIKKIVFADFIAVNFVDRVFNSPLSYSGFENILAVYGYSLQIYCDFSGYTDIAIGLALMMGFKLPVNFNEPYKAANLTGFWRRWHISLSLWLRDYLYIPLGGNRKGKFRTYINLFVTMVLGGLWHGAHLRFIIWGAIHGLGLVFDKAWRSFFGKPGNRGKTLNLLKIFLTFNLVTFSWLFFRAESREIISQMVYQATNSFSLAQIPEIARAYWLPFSVMAAGFLFVWLPFRWKEWSRGVFIKTHWLVKALIVVAVVLLLYRATTTELQAFIYFRF